MGAISDALLHDLTQVEFSEGYAESFLNSYIATQIKVLREQCDLTQAKLAEIMGTTQTAISRIENINYSGWNIGTLKKLARAFNVRLKVSFEEYGTLPFEVESFGRKSLRREPRHKDPRLVHAHPITNGPAHETTGPASVSAIIRNTAGGNLLIMPTVTARDGGSIPPRNTTLTLAKKPAQSETADELTTAPIGYAYGR